MLGSIQDTFPRLSHFTIKQFFEGNIFIFHHFIDKETEVKGVLSG